MITVGYLVVNVGLFSREDIDRRQRVADELVDADVNFLQSQRGPRVVESTIEEEWAVPGLIDLVDRHEDRVDAFAIGCFGDPGLDALREYTDVPVVGPAEVTTHTAAMVGERFSLLNLTEKTEPVMERLIRGYSLEGRLASVRTLDVGVADIDDQSEDLARQMVAEGQTAVEEDGADALIPGCMGLAFVQNHNRVSEAMDVPFLDPLALALETAEAWARHGISQSPTASPDVDRSRLTGLGEAAGTKSDDD